MAWHVNTFFPIHFFLSHWQWKQMGQGSTRMQEELEGISTLDLRDLLNESRSNNDERVQTAIAVLANYKPVSNYTLREPPDYLDPRWHFLHMSLPRWSKFSIDKHIQALKLTAECIVWVDKRQQKNVQFLYDMLPDLSWNEMIPYARLGLKAELQKILAPFPVCLFSIIGDYVS